MQCPRCHAESRFCGECGSRLPLSRPISAERRATSSTGRLHTMCAPVIAMTFVLFVFLGVGVVDARDCRDETPLPADVKLVPPGPDVSATAARFAGTWIGAWGENSVDTVCATLVVEELLSTGHARVIYSHGAWAPLQIPQPRFFRATGRIVDGVLHFVLPLPDRAPFAYRFAPDGSLSGTLRGGGNHALTRAADASGIGCHTQIPHAVLSPTGSGPRDRLTSAELLASTPGDGPIHNDYFMPFGPTAPARHSLRGTLTISAS